MSTQETIDEIRELELLYDSDRATYLGESRRAGQWTGEGVNCARRIQAGLQSSPPSNFATPGDSALHRQALERVGRIVG